ncbi:Mediator of RNA polymerase II transcription subunit 7 [Phytophthora cinnamomi]|uniref:Mediator of RNA polymerase II transcription subunit 7 n=1 Tax=Phytophthora cinnamomi TaxID=4785 RepID=UPI0035598F30|nr:Mediator of RNA polymerase II transcription subunit 7 [Phytophthora cinnamomi]
MLARRRETNGTDEFPAAPAPAIAAANGAVDGGDRKHENHAVATTSEAQEKMYEAVNERIARRMIDGVEQPNRGAATASTSEDKSDTLSDCTTTTETSSVYGIHNTWVDLATLYSLPFVMSDSNRRLKPVPPLNIAQEQSHLSKIFQECQRAVHTMRAVATVDALRKVLDRGVTVLHFSGHGGRIVGQSQHLMFEDTQCSGLAHLVDSATLRNILNSGMSPSTVEEVSISENSALEVVEEDGVHQFGWSPWDEWYTQAGICVVM